MRFFVLCALLGAAIACADQSGPRVHETAAVSLVAEDLSTCALTTSGAAYCWGADSVGQLGIGEIWTCISYPTCQPSSGKPHLMPVAVAGGHRFAALSGGGAFVCAATAEGQPWCWGERLFTQRYEDSVPTDVAASPPLTSISAGAYHACGLTSSGKAYCWGENHLGQLGSGGTEAHATPVAVTGGLTFSSVTVGTVHTCGLTPQGVAYCWGDTSTGALGDGRDTLAATVTPTPVSGGLRFKSLSAGAGYSCGESMAGTGYCWGLNFTSELGAGTSAASVATPVAVSGGIRFASIATATTITFFSTTCGLSASGAAYCWGYNQYGQVGNPSANAGGCDIPGPTCVSVPVAVAGGLSFATISVGGTQVCGVTNGGAIYCWGGNAYGQLGDGTTTDSPLPQLVSGVTAP